MNILQQKTSLRNETTKLVEIIKVCVNFPHFWLQANGVLIFRTFDFRLTVC